MLFQPSSDGRDSLDAWEPLSLNRPEMIDRVGKRFRRYEHYGKIPTKSERSLVRASAPGDARPSGDADAIRTVRADVWHGTPMAAMPVARGRMRWLLDIGTGNRLVHLARAIQVEGRRDEIETSDEPLNLWTAKGIT